MWISEQGRRRTEPDGTALVGRVTLPGDPAGQAGEAPCVAGQACGQDWNLAAGEVLIYSGSASIRIGGGGIRLTGDVLVNGKPVLTGEG